MDREIKKELVIITLKGRFNYLLLRNKAGEEFFYNMSPEECDPRYLKLFNQITSRLSLTREQLEILLDRKLTDKELTSGIEI